MNTVSQFHSVISQCREIFKKKTKDYGTAWRILRLPSITDQIFIKAKRIRSIQENEVQLVDEGIDGEFIAIVNYCVMALIQLDLDDNEEIEMPADKVLSLYDKYINDTLDLLSKKNHDYGEAWRDMRVSSMTDIILMKIFRTKQIEENKGKTLISEGVDANYQDMINYSVFCLIKLEEQINS